MSWGSSSVPQGPCLQGGSSEDDQEKKGGGSCWDEGT